MRKEKAEQKYISILRRMDGNKRVKIGAGLYEMARKIVLSSGKHKCYPLQGRGVIEHKSPETLFYIRTMSKCSANHVIAGASEAICEASRGCRFEEILEEARWSKHRD